MSMILAKDRPDLVKRVRILLDGVDVTANCYGFDVEAGAAGLYDRDARGVKRIEYFCPSCSAVGVPAGKTAPWCAACERGMEARAVRAVHHGALEVVPVSPEEVVA